jgi:DNA-directed RNA polymerase specialized sigma24 family protein
VLTQVTSSPRNPGRFTRAQRSAKRGGGRPQQPLDDAVEVGAVVEPSAAATSDLVDLDRALAALEVQDARKVRVVEQHFFGGLTFEEIAKALTISLATVDRDMRLARAWLRDALQHEGDGGR